MKNGKVVQAPACAIQTPGLPDVLLDSSATFDDVVLPTPANDLAGHAATACPASSDNRGNIKILYATPL
jgi:hypothetical protein